MRRISTDSRQQDMFGPGKDGFTNGDAVIGVPSTDLHAEWFNALQEEVAGVVEASGQVLVPADNTQLLQAIRTLIGTRPLVYSILQIPATSVGPAIIVTEAGEVWPWVTTAHFTGYRSPLCGRPLDGHTTAPAAHEIDAVGGTLSKTAYARLWAYARENNLVVTQAVWNSNIGAHYFVDTGADTFRVPDLRNMFRRYSGTDADTANARAMGSRQAGSIHSFDIGPGVGLVGDRSGVVPVSAANARIDLGYDAVAASEYPAAQVVPMSGGTPSSIVNTGEIAFGMARVQNTAYAPRIHAWRDRGTANARAMGGRQDDAAQRWDANIGWLLGASTSGVFIGNAGNSRWSASATAGTGHQHVAGTLAALQQIRTSTETRPVNVAYAPRLHA